MSHVCSFEGTEVDNVDETCYNSSAPVGDWSNGMIGVSKTFGGSSILSSPADKVYENLLIRYSYTLFFCIFQGVHYES